MNTPPPSDIDLTQAYVRLKEQLRAHLRRRGLEAAAAADVVQEVFLRALAHQQAGKAIANINGWLFTAVRNAAIDHLRATRPTVPLDEDLCADSPADVELHAAIASCLRPLTKDLPEIYRDAIQAVNLDQLAMREIAQREGVSISAIKSRASRGRQMLRDALLRCCVIEFQGGLVGAAKQVGNCACRVKLE
jgi:RNA polymerase sigma-70 factor, ECF subfamily